MKNNYFIIHGTYGSPKDNWFQWLKTGIELKGLQCTLPEFETKENVNNYLTREKILKQYLADGVINENTTFIGHSSGSVIAAKFIIENHVKVKGLISVSGFNNVNGPYEEYNKINNDFFLPDEELSKINDYTKFVYCLYSDNDPYLNLEDLEKFAKITKSEHSLIKGAGHLNAETGYNTFPEVLKIVTQVEDGLALMEIDDLPIGINFIVQNDNNQILLGRRINRFGEGTYSLIGGKLKNRETLEDCAIRELKEEINIDVEKEDLEVINIATTVTNRTFLQIGILVKRYKGTPEIIEKHKCDDLRFFDLNNLPGLFVGTKPNIELFKNKQIYNKDLNI